MKPEPANELVIEMTTHWLRMRLVFGRLFVEATEPGCYLSFISGEQSLDRWHLWAGKCPTLELTNDLRFYIPREAITTIHERFGVPVRYPAPAPVPALPAEAGLAVAAPPLPPGDGELSPASDSASAAEAGPSVETA